MQVNKPLNIAFISRSTLFSSPGGDTIQIQMTAKYLKALGNIVHIYTSNEKIVYKEFDLLHFFNITRPADILPHISKANKPFFISPIYLDLSEYERRNRKGIQGFITRYFSPSRVEYLKCLVRHFRNGEKINSWNYIFAGHNNSIKSILSKCAAILPNSYSEYHRIQNTLGYTGAYAIVPCGVDLEIFETMITKKDQNLVLCVGRIEGRKNQLLLIRALKNTPYKLIIIGNPSPNHQAYYDECKKAANENVTFIENIEQSALISYYNQAKVHVLASWFETVGLSSLEAAFCRCNIVICDKGDAKEYFQNNAWYCNPESESEILEAVTNAINAPDTNIFENEIRVHYNWEVAAQKTLAAYQSLV